MAKNAQDFALIPLLCQAVPSGTEPEAGLALRDTDQRPGPPSSATFSDRVEPEGRTFRTTRRSRHDRPAALYLNRVGTRGHSSSPTVATLGCACKQRSGNSLGRPGQRALFPRGKQYPLEPAPPPLLFELFIAAIPAIVASAFSAATAAMGALSSARKRALRELLSGRARAALARYLDAGGAIEARWLVLRVLGIATSALLVHAELPSRFGQWTTPIAVAVALVTYSIPSEIARVIVTRTADRSGPLLLRMLRPFEIIVAPVAAPVTWIGSIIGRALSDPMAPSADITENEVEIIVSEGERNGSLDHDQSEMIRNVLDFGDTTSGEVMVPRTQIAGFEMETPPRQVLAGVIESEHSRYPIYRERIDNIVGVLHVKDLMNFLIPDGNIDGLRIQQLMRRPVMYSAEGQTASSVLKEMRQNRQHMAVVLDEFGGVAGIVTLEDLLEEIVGDIRDEHDEDDSQIVELDDGRIMVDASVPILELSRYLGTPLPESDDYNSLGGFLIARLGRLPAVGVRVKFNHLEFVVRDADERHVASVEILRDPPSDGRKTPEASTT